MTDRVIAINESSTRICIAIPTRDRVEATPFDSARERVRRPDLARRFGTPCRSRETRAYRCAGRKGDA
jgi:hypothetical protein